MLKIFLTNIWPGLFLISQLHNGGFSPKFKFITAFEVIIVILVYTYM